MKNIKISIFKILGLKMKIDKSNFKFIFLTLVRYSFHRLQLYLELFSTAKTFTNRESFSIIIITTLRIRIPPSNHKTRTRIPLIKRARR